MENPFMVLMKVVTLNSGNQPTRLGIIVTLNVFLIINNKNTYAGTFFGI